MNILKCPKGNGLVRQVKQANRECVKEIMAQSAITAGSMATALSIAPLIPTAEAHFSSYFSGVFVGGLLYARTALKGIKEIIKKHNGLVASNEYQAILERAKNIKSR